MSHKKITFKAYSKRWLDAYCTDLSPSTKRQYLFDLKNHILPVFGERKLKKIKRFEIQCFVNELELSPKTVKNIFGIISKIFNDAALDGLIAESPCKKIRLPKGKPVERMALEKVQVKELIKNTRESRYGRLTEFILLTGLRISEVIGLLPDAIDLESKSLTVKRQISRDGKDFVPPKHHKVRTIPLPDRAVEILKEYLAYEGAYVFIQTEGKGRGNKINSRAYNRFLKNAGEMVGFKNLSAHILRHTYATLLLEAGVSPKVIQKSLGHHSSDFTLSVYTHATEAGEEKLAAVLNALTE